MAYDVKVTLAGGGVEALSARDGAFFWSAWTAQVGGSLSMICRMSATTSWPPVASRTRPKAST
jgi:hypothetical protein